MMLRHHCSWLRRYHSFFGLVAFVIVLIVGLSACTPKLPPGQSAQDVAQCKFVCQQRALACQKTCRNHCGQCRAYAESQMSKRYQYYKYEQQVKGECVIRRLKSYDNPLQCVKTTCNCVMDYQVCRQSCSGFVHKQLLVPPVCR